MFKSLRIKVVLMVLCLIVVMLTLLTGQFVGTNKHSLFEKQKEANKMNAESIYSLLENFNGDIEIIKSTKTNDVKNRLKELVQNGMSILSHFYEKVQNGEMTDEEAQEAAKSAIRSLRFGKDGYFWIDNDNYILQVLPPAPDKEGMDRKNLEDINGKKMVKELVDGAVRNGETYVEYWFRKLGDENLSPKLGYTQYFKPWGWVIGTGEYIDNIEKEITVLEEEGLKKLNKVIYKNATNSAYPVIFDNEEDIIGHIDSSMIGKKLEFEDKKTGESLSKKFLEMEDGEIEYYYSKNGTGVFKKIGYVKHFKERNWVIVYSAYEDDLLAPIKKSTIGIIITSMIYVIILAGIIIFAIGYMLKNIRVITSKIDQMANGDFKEPIDIKSQDEIGKIANSLNNLIYKMNDTVGNVKKLTAEVVNNNNELSLAMENIVNGNGEENSNRIKDGIVQLKEYMREIMDSVRNQTASTEESLAGLEEIAATSRNMGEYANQTLDSSKQSVKNAGNGINNINTLQDSMKVINSSVKNANDKIDNLRELSGTIGNILTAINGLSDQTNLLALNAAIEAARAGEAGKGFAVVAEEIRKLAEKTNGETEKIEKVISEIQEEVDKVTNANREVSENVGKGLSATGEVRSSVDLVVSSIEESDSKINDIVTSMEEQTTASNEITIAVSTITENSSYIEDKTTTTYNVVEEISQILINKLNDVIELSEAAQKLQADIDYFQVNNS